MNSPWNCSGTRIRPRKYGENRINLSKLADSRDDWETIRYACQGIMIEARYKTFLATSHVVGGNVRVVILEHASGNWAAYISTEASMSVKMILKTVSERWAIEEHFHDVK